MGAARGLGHVAYVTVGTGIGMACGAHGRHARHRPRIRRSATSRCSAIRRTHRRHLPYHAQCAGLLQGRRSRRLRVLATYQPVRAIATAPAVRTLIAGYLGGSRRHW